MNTYKKHEWNTRKPNMLTMKWVLMSERKRDTMLRKKLYERHMKTVKKQAQRYDDFLAAERIKRATLWTDSESS